MSATQTLRSLVTAEELFAMGDEARYELNQGELREMAPPGGEHGNKTERLSSRATVYADDQDLGECFAAETGFLIGRNPDTVRGPDWAFIAKERLPNPIPRKYVPVVPDLVLETRSPNDTPQEVATKVEEWLQAGVMMVWELNPAAKQLTVHRLDREPILLTPNDTLAGEDVLPGFELALARVFR